MVPHQDTRKVRGGAGGIDTHSQHKQQMPGPTLPYAHGAADVFPQNQGAQENLPDDDHGEKGEVEQAKYASNVIHLETTR